MREQLGAEIEILAERPVDYVQQQVDKLWEHFNGVTVANQAQQQDRRPISAAMSATNQPG